MYDYIIDAKSLLSQCVYCAHPALQEASGSLSNFAQLFFYPNDKHRKPCFFKPAWRPSRSIYIRTVSSYLLLSAVSLTCCLELLKMVYGPFGQNNMKNIVHLIFAMRPAKKKMCLMESVRVSHAALGSSNTNLK